MKNVISLLLIFITTLTACDFCTNPDREEVMLNLSPLEKELSQSDNAFTFDLLKKMAEGETGNLFISPLSVSMAFGMVYNGASGETKSEIAELLGLSDYTGEEVNEYYNKMIKRLPKLDNKVTMEIANSIWIREGFPVEQKFLDINIDYF
ncbi:MAG: serpin family protein, partial [Fidelibacterota bacterium]